MLYTISELDFKPAGRHRIKVGEEDPDEIVIHLDGDDWLYDETVLEKLKRQKTASKTKRLNALFADQKEYESWKKNRNVLTIPARFVSIQQALGFVELFLNTEFEGGRHSNRVDKISC